MYDISEIAGIYILILLTCRMRAARFIYYTGCATIMLELCLCGTNIAGEHIKHYEL